MKWLMGAAAAVLAAAQTPVIVISIDTLRADHLSAYGYAKLKTPNIDSFGEQGTIFSAVDAQVPLTLPSHTALFTSTYPFENGIEENAEVVPANRETLASVLRSHGYRTAAFIGSNMLDRRFGLDRGFDEYDSPFGAAEGNPYSARVRRDGALVLRGAKAWLGAHGDQPVFLFVHLFDLHAPYRLAPGRGSNEPEGVGYDAELAYIDRILGGFRQFLMDAGWWRKSLIVLLADHGESLGDHGERSHGYFVYQSTVHVPLMVHWPEGAARLPQRVTQPGGLVDVAPTILDTLGLPAPGSFDGVSLLKNGEHAVFSESVYARDAFQWAALRSLRAGRFQYIDARQPELYDLEKDPEEKSNLARTKPEEAAALRLELARLMSRHPRGEPGAANAARTELGSLGYLAGGARKAASPDAPDPKEKLAEYQMFDRALDALYSGREEAAIRGFREVLAMDRGNLPARGNLGDAYLREGKAAAAIREWTAALEADAKYSPAAQALGEYYAGAREWTKARPYFQQALAAAPGDTTVRFELGVAERKLGMFKEALADLKQACAANPSSGVCRSEIRLAAKTP